MRSRTDLILPLKIEASMRRKVLFRKITGDTLTVVHAPPNMVFGSKGEGKRSDTVTRVEASADVIPWLSFEDVFISRSGVLVDLLSRGKINLIYGKRNAVSDIEETTHGLMRGQQL